MNHRAIVQAESERLYANRSYVLGELDDRHFDALNVGGHVVALNGYCLDALDDLPCGSMETIAGHPAETFVTRGVSLSEQLWRKALAERLIKELLAEEVAPRDQLEAS